MFIVLILKTTFYIFTLDTYPQVSNSYETRQDISHMPEALKKQSDEMNGERRKMTLHKLRLRIQKKIPRTIYGRVIFSVVSKTIIIFQFARLVIVYV